MKRILIWVIVWMGMHQAYGQGADSGAVELPIFQKETPIIIDSIAPKSTQGVVTVDSFLWEYKVRKNAKRAGMYAALLPGLGQAYNKAYWRIGAVYAVLGTSTGFIIYNYSEWNGAKRELAYRQTYNQSRDPKLLYLNNSQLASKQDYDKQNLDVSVLITGVGYLLNIIEAVSYNHLKDFDISPDISMRIKASSLPHYQVGIGVAFQFK